MKMGTIVKIGYLVSCLFTIMGAFYKIMHLNGAEALLIIGAIATLIFIALAIYEVTNSSRISVNEKIMWVIAFIFFSGLAGLIYFFIGRRRIVIV